MCVSASQASFSDTILYAAEMCRAGEIVHVMGYQNAVENRVIGANAMILPIPSFDDMGPENLIDTKPFSNVLRDLVSGLQPRSRSMSKTGAIGSRLEKLPDNHRWMFEGRYSLTTIKHATPNADFVLPVEVARSGRHVSWRDMVE